MPRLFALITIVLVYGSAMTSAASETLSASDRALYRKYLNDTVKSVELMRDPTTGLVGDQAAVEQAGGKCKQRLVDSKTSPTNIALDLINQLDLLNDPKYEAQASKNLEKVLTTLHSMPYNSNTGLFYSWYTAEGKPMGDSLSSVDNIHLSLALWTVTKLHPDKRMRALAEEMFSRMDYSRFVHFDEVKGGLVSRPGPFGRKRYEQTKDAYSYFGSEARSIYSLGSTLGLFKTLAPDISKTTRTFDDGKPAPVAEIYNWQGDKPIMNVNDGGTFQLFLPQLLACEDRRSKTLSKSFDNYSAFIVDESKKMHYQLPAAFSACDQAATINAKQDPVYVGGAGSAALLAAGNKKLMTSPQFNRVVTPHGVFMAATRDPKTYAGYFRKMETLQSLTSPKKGLYCDGLGFMDGYHVSGPDAHEVVPFQNSLDQGMTIMSLNHILSPDKSASCRALKNDRPTDKSLNEYYTKFEKVLNAAPVSSGQKAAPAAQNGSIK